MKVKIKEVQELTNKVFESINDNYGDEFEVELTEDFYHFIPKELLYKIEEEPREFTLGSLLHDVEDLRGAVSCDRIVSYHLNRVSSIVRYLGDIISLKDLK